TYDRNNWYPPSLPTRRSSDLAFILQKLVFDAWGVPFVVTVIGIILVIWLYSHKSGIKTIIWTDWLQTILFITALLLIVWQIGARDRKSTRLNSSHVKISYAVF